MNGYATVGVAGGPSRLVWLNSTGRPSVPRLPSAMLRVPAREPPGFEPKMEVKGAKPSRSYDTEYPPRRTGSELRIFDSNPVPTFARHTVPTLGRDVVHVHVVGPLAALYWTRTGACPFICPGLKRLFGPVTP